MKQFSLIKWILLGSVLAIAPACNQKQEEQRQQRGTQHDEDRDDGDMCSLESSEEESSPALAEKSTPSKEAFSSEVKTVLPVPAAPAVKRQISENEAKPTPVEKAESSEKSAAV